jgi:hypothetical protein
MTVGTKQPATGIICIQIIDEIFFELTIKVNFTSYGFDLLLKLFQAFGNEVNGKRSVKASLANGIT